jgi:hypothetical protein
LRRQKKIKAHMAAAITATPPTTPPTIGPTGVEDFFEEDVAAGGGAVDDTGAGTGVLELEVEEGVGVGEEELVDETILEVERMVELALLLAVVVISYSGIHWGASL